MDRDLPLVITGVHKCFKDHQVLHDINLAIKPGELFGLIGLNGVGKTTLIKIILNLISADRGEVHLFGVPVQEMESRKRISYLPEKFIPSAFLRGVEFLSLSLSYFKRKYDHETAIALAQRLYLDTEVLEQKLGKYSKGMGQKLGLLSVFLSQAPFLILDEPMSGLDPNARIRLKDLLVEYCKQGNTIFFSSHILSDIEEICDRIAVIDDGRILFVGKPELFRKEYGGDNLERAFLSAISKPVEVISE